MRPATLLVCVAFSLGFASGAGAKGMTSVRACGPDVCVVLGDPLHTGWIVTVAEVVEAPPPRAPYYRLDITHGAGRQTETFSDLFVPSSGLVAADSGAARALLWYQPAGRATETLRSAVRDLAPYAAPAVWPVAVEESIDGVKQDGRDWMAYALGAGLIVLTLVGYTLSSKRLRIRRPRTA